MTPMEQIEQENASGISLPEAFLYSLLTPAQVLGRLTVVEDVEQQAPAVFYNADVTVESGIRKAVHASLHHMTFFICAFSLRFGSKHNYHTTTNKSIERCQRKNSIHFRGLNTIQQFTDLCYQHSDRTHSPRIAAD